MASGPTPRRSAEPALPYDDGTSRTDVTEKVLSPEELSSAWADWIERGPQGPIEDDDSELEDS